MCCQTSLISTLDTLDTPDTRRFIRRRLVGASGSLSSGSDPPTLPATRLVEPQVTLTILVLTPGVEPGTSSLPMKCSTA